MQLGCDLCFLHSLLEERLAESAQQIRRLQATSSDLSSQLSATTSRVEEREEQVHRLGEEVRKSNEEKNALKEALRAESERQVIVAFVMSYSKPVVVSNAVTAIDKCCDRLQPVVRVKSPEKVRTFLNINISFIALLQ